jgi:hypothetical protein
MRGRSQRMGNISAVQRRFATDASIPQAPTRSYVTRFDRRSSQRLVAEKNLTFWKQAARMASTLHAARPFQSVSTFVYRSLNSHISVILCHPVKGVYDFPDLDG